ncbi:MAG: peptidase domain-containing ABC transporter [Woeseiaceae bacterium]
MTAAEEHTPLGSQRSGKKNEPAAIPSLKEAFLQFVRLFRLIRPYWSPLVQGLLLGLVVGLVGMIPPLLSKLLIDEVYPSGGVTLMHLIVGGLVAIGFASAFMGAIRSYFTQVVGAKLNNATTLMFFNHLQHLPIRFFDEHRVGEIMSRFQDVRGSLGAVSQVLETVLVRGVYLLLVPPVLFLLNWKLACLALATIPLTAVISALTARVMRKYWKKSAEAQADLNAFEVEVLSHIRMLKSMALESTIFRRANDQVDRALRYQLTASGLGTGIGALNNVLRTAGTTVTTLFAWTLILHQEMTLGSYIAFTGYIGYLTGPISRIASLFSSFQHTAVTLVRMFEYLDIQPEQNPRNAYEPLEPVGDSLEGAIRLQDVSFAYTVNCPVLERVTLEIPTGEVVAIVGPSGAGKSTLLKLLCRIEDPTAGNISYGGRDVTRMALPDLRRQVAMVWQDASLLQGTVWENLVLARETASEIAVQQAVQLCHLERLVADLPMGYETPIAEWGASLSGGQRQRLAIARALIQDTPVLLLDEATSSVDVDTEIDILRQLFVRDLNKTILFTTHRLANVVLSDRVAVLLDGRLAAFGPHETLLEECDAYRKMYNAVAMDDKRRLRVMGN